MRKRSSNAISQFAERALALWMSALFVFSASPAMAAPPPAPAPQRTSTFSATGALPGLAGLTGAPAVNGYQFDLHSGQSSVPVTTTALQGQQQVVVNRGGMGVTVLAGLSTTSASLLAAQQIVQTGMQRLLLNENGAATGGSFSLNMAATQNVLSALVIPQGVRAIHTVDNNNIVQIPGSLINYGSIFGLSTTTQNTVSVIAANTIVNEFGGLISTNLPADLAAAHPGALAHLDLTLSAFNNIINKGTISSSGSLTVGSAYGAVSNIGATTSTPAAGIMQAHNDLNVISGGGHFVNSGLISSIAGNVNIATLNQADLTVNGQAGRFEALAGAINLNNTASARNTAVAGGDWLSKELNFNAVNGALTAALEQVTGVINVEACSAKLFANSDNLQIGTWNLTGDPVIANTNTITLSSSINTNGAPLLIVSGQDVVSSVAGISINTSSATTNGGTLTILAGAVFSPEPYSTGNITITGASVTGGSIDLKTNPITGISSQSTAAVGDGGNITLAAFEGATAGSGKILLPATSTVASGGNGDAGPGFIFVVAGASTGSAATPGISVGNLDSSGGFHVGVTGLAGGHQVIATAQPGINPTNPWVIEPNSGATLRGGVLGGAVAAAPIVANSIKTEGGQVIVFSGLGIEVGTASTLGTKVIDTAPPTLPGGMVTLVANASGSTTQNVDINIQGDINTSGAAALSGPVVASTTGNFSAGTITTSNTSGSGDAASVNIVTGSPNSPGNVSLDGVDASATNGSAGNVVVTSMGTGGTVAIGANGSGVSVNTSAGAGNGGAVTVSSPGSITLAGDILSQGTQNGGSVFVASGAVPGAQITVGDINTSTSSGNAADRAGGVYLLSTQPSGMPTAGTITQTQSAGTATLNVVSYIPTRTSIVGGDGAVTLNFTNGVTPFQYAPGGYFNVDDQAVGGPGGVQIALTVGNNDPNLIVPIVSLAGGLQLIGDSGNPSSITSNMSGASSYALLSPAGINVGGAYAFLTTSTPGGTVPVALAASSLGSLTVDNSSASGQALRVGTAVAASGPLLLSSNLGLTVGPVLNAYATGTSVSLDAIGAGATLNINGNITFGSSVSLMPTGIGNISENINIYPSVIGGGAAVVGNPSMVGNISGPLSPDVLTLTVISDLATTSNSLVVGAVGAVALVLSVGGTLNFSASGPVTLIGDSDANILTLTSNGLFAIESGFRLRTSSVSTINASSARIDGTINFFTGGTLTTAGNIDGTGLVKAASGNLNLVSTAGNIGSSTQALLVRGGGGSPLNLDATATANTIGNGNIWLRTDDVDSAPLSPATLLNGSAGSGLVVAAQSGTFSFTSLFGTIGIHPTSVSASSQVSLVAQNSIIQLHGEVINAPSISLTAITGNIGVDASTPLLVSSGASGNIQLNLVASATANTVGNGNILLQSFDINAGATPAVKLQAAAGSGVAVSQSGMLVYAQPFGTISIPSLGLVSASSQLVSSSFALTNTGSISAGDTITMNINGGTLTNNGLITTSMAAGSGPSITVQNLSGSFGLAGIGQFQLTNAVPGLTAFRAGTAIVFSHGTNQLVNATTGTAAVSIISPTISVDRSAPLPAAAALSTDGGAITVQANSAGTGTLTLAVGLSGAIAAALALNNGTVLLNATNVTINPGVNLSSTGPITVNVNNGTFTNNGTIASSLSAGTVPTILIQNPLGGFTVAGVGTISQTAAIPGLTAFAAAGTMTLTNGVAQTVNNGVGSAAAELAIFATKLTMNAPSGTATALFATNNGGEITVTPNPAGKGSLQFSVAGGATNGTLSLNCGIGIGEVNTVVDGSVTVDANVMINSNTFTKMTFLEDPTPGQLVLLGTVRSTAVGNAILVRNPTGSFTLTGAGGAFDTPAGSLTFQALDSINFADGLVLTLLGDNATNFRAPNMTFAGNSSVVSLGLSNISFNSGTANSDMTFIAPEGANVTFGTLLGNISLQPTGTASSLTFTNSTPSPVQNANYSFFGGPLSMTVGTGVLALDTKTLVNSDFAVTATVNGGTLRNNGTLQSSAFSLGLPTILVQSASGFSMDGVGTFTHASTIAPGMTRIQAVSNITLLDGLSQTFNATGAFYHQMQIQSPKITVDGNGTATATLTNNGGATTLTSATGTIIYATGSNVTSTATLNINDANVNTTSDNITVNSGFHFASNNPITLNLNFGGTLTNNGTVASTAGAADSITVTSATGIFSVTGTGGSILTPGGSALLTGFNTITVGAGVNQSFSSLSIRTRNLNLNGGSISVGTGLTIDSGLANNSLTISAPENTTTTFSVAAGPLSIQPTGVNSSLIFANSTASPTGNAVINFDGADLTTTTALGNTQINANVQLASNSGITFNVNGGTFNNNGRIVSSTSFGNLTPTILVTSSTGTLRLAGTGDINTRGITRFSGTTSIIVADGTSQTNTLTPLLGGPASYEFLTSSLLIDNTSGAASASFSTQSGTTIAAASPGPSDLTLAGTSALNLATLTINGDGSVFISASAPTVATNFVLNSDQSIGFFNGTPQLVTVNGTVNSTFAGNGIVISGDSPTLAGSGTLNPANGQLFVSGDTKIGIASGTSLTITGGNAANFSAPLIDFLGTSSLQFTGASTVTFDSGLASVLTIQAPQATAVTVSTIGGSFLIGPTGGAGDVSVLNSTVASTQNAVLNFNGGPVSLAANGAMVIGKNAVLATNNVLTVAMSGGTLQVDGTLQSSAPSGPAPTILVQNTGGLITLSGTGTFAQTNAVPGLTQFSAASELVIGTGTALLFNNGAGSAPVNLSIISPVVAVDGLSGTATASLTTTGNINVSSPTGALEFEVCSGGATAASLQLNGNATTGIITLSPATVNDSVIINNAFTLSSINPVSVESCSLTYIGTGTIVTPSLTLDCPNCAGTIANTSGDVTISGDLTYNGLSLALLASRDVIATGSILIDLSNSLSTVNAGNGGQLLVVAGFDFTPLTSGQVGPVQTLFQIGAASATGGSVSMPNVFVDTSTSVNGANAGSVLVVANTDGAGARGSVNIGGIFAAGDVNGGAVTIFAPGGSTLGAITTVGLTNSGNVSITSQNAVPTGNVLVGSGLLLSGSFQPSGVLTSGNIQISIINSGASTVVLQNAGTGSITQTFGSIIAGNLTLSAGSGGVGAALLPVNVSTPVLTANAIGSGDVYITNQANNVLLTGVNSADIYSLVMTTSAQGAITLDLGLTLVGATSVTLAASGTGNISQLGGFINAPTVTLSGDTGNISAALAAPLAVSTSFLSVTTHGSASIANTTPVISTALGVFDSNVDAGFTLTNNRSISIGNFSSIAPATFTVDPASNGSIVVTGNMNTGSLSLLADGTGTISQTGVASITSSNLILSTGTGNVTLGQGTTSVIASQVQINTGGSASLNNAIAGIISASTIGGAFNFSSLGPTTIGGNLSIGSGTFVVPQLLNNAAITTTGGPTASILIQSLPTTSLIIGGNGSGSITAGGTLTFASANNGIEFSANQSLTAPTITMNALNSGVQFDPPSVVTVAGNLTINTQVLFNPDGINQVSGTSTFNVSPSASFGSIVNTNGDVVLTPTLLVNTFGKSLLIAARDNVIASNLGTINLQGTSTKAGSLTILAGFNFLPLTGGQTTNINTTFRVTGPSVGGGSITLTNTSIITSAFATTSGNNLAGSVLMVANQGTTSAGTIFVGAISTNATSGFGGGVKLYGPGGVTVGGAINTSGPLGAGAVDIQASTATSTGTVLFQNGFLSPSANFVPAGPVSGSGAGVSVNGAISTNSLNAIGGALTLRSDAALSVTGPVSTSGAQASGTLVASTINGAIVFGAGITTAGTNIFSGPVPGATAGDITITAPDSITIKGNITANGASTQGTGQAGAGAAVSITTTNLGLVYTGNVAITGAVNVAGGNARTTSGGGVGGSGGSVSIRTGAMQVSGTIFANGASGSIVATGGTGFAGIGANGSVALATYSVQPLPANFNLTSSSATEYALPGGLFQVGIFPIVNGTANNIVVGSSVANSNSAGGLTEGTFTRGPIVISVVGGPSTIIVGGNPVSVSPDFSTGRQKVTPAQAAALYQVSLGNTQTLRLNSNGQLLDGVTANTLTVPGYALPQFTSFVLQATGTNKNNILLNVTGLAPILNLSSAFTQTISGSITFTTPSSVAMLNIGSISFNILANASVSAANTLVLAGLGTPWVNSGSITSAHLVLLNPMGAITLTNNSGASITTTDILLPANGLSNSINISNKQGTMTAPILFAPVLLATGYGTQTSGLTPGGLKAASTNLTVSLLAPGATQQAAMIGGALSGSTALTLTTAGNQPASALTTPLTLLAGTNINISQGITINSNGPVSIGTGSSLISGASMTITAPSLTITGSALQSKFGLLVNAAGAVTTIGTGSPVTMSSTSGSVTVNSSGGSINLGPNTQINGITGVSLGAFNSATTITVGGVGLSSSLVSANGAVNVNGLGGVNVQNSTLNGKTNVMVNAALGAITDNGGGTYISTGLIAMSARSVAFGALSSITTTTSPVLLTASAGNFSLVGTSGNPAAITGSQITINASGNINTGFAQVTASTLFGLNSSTGQINDSGSSSFTSNGTIPITLTASTNINIGPASTVSTKSGLTFNALRGSASFGVGSIITNNAGALNVQANQGTVTLNGTLQSGVLSGSAPLTGVINPSFITSSGSINVTSGGGASAGGITIGNNAVAVSAGNNVKMTAGVGGIAFGATTRLQANGGNIIVLTNGKVSQAVGTAGDIFIARAMGTTTTAPTSGGGIEIGGGTTVSQLAIAQAKAPGVYPQPPVTIGNVQINNSGGTTGVVQVNITNSGSVNLSTFSTQTVFNLQGGAIVLDSSGSANTVQLDGAVFTVNALKPIAYSYSVVPATEFWTEASLKDADMTSADAASSTSSENLAYLFVSGRANLQVLRAKAAESKSNGGDAIKDANTNENDNPNASDNGLTLTMRSGEVFLHPVTDTTVRTAFGDLRVRKGAMLTVIASQHSARVANCGQTGEVLMNLPSVLRLSINSGEEVILSSASLTADEHLRADGVGRRNFRQVFSAKNLCVTSCEFSIVSLIGNANHLRALSHPESSVERKISSHMMKTAAALQMLTAGKGAYQARAPHASHQSRPVYSPVSCATP